jgi:hypothetical protein
MVQKWPPMRRAVLEDRSGPWFDAGREARSSVGRSWNYSSSRIRGFMHGRQTESHTAIFVCVSNKPNRLTHHLESRLSTHRNWIRCMVLGGSGSWCPPSRRRTCSDGLGSPLLGCVWPACRPRVSDSAPEVFPASKRHSATCGSFPILRAASLDSIQYVRDC